MSATFVTSRTSSPLERDTHSWPKRRELKSDRPETGDCLVHPLFWTPAKRLAFLCDASDRESRPLLSDPSSQKKTNDCGRASTTARLIPAGFEILNLDPPEPPIVALEARAFEVVGKDWFSRADRVFTSNLGKYRKYKGNSVRDLLRAMRNKVSVICRCGGRRG